LDQAEKEVAKAILKYMTLAGDVQRELADGIKRVILQGIVQGKGTDDIVRDLGHVVIYKDSFRQAGTRVFSKSQYRMEMIARTEVLRAHNMGRLRFHRKVGIQKLEWMTMDDERTCQVCGPLDGKKYSISDTSPTTPVSNRPKPASWLRPAEKTYRRR
jgi:SPP1 gp7 family putative phage head morphogenesis protein